MSLLSLLIVFSVLSHNEVVGRKTFKTKYGDIYECVDFYKQPSFNHPMLKNHSFHPQMKPSFLAKRSEKRTYVGKNKSNIEGCHVGTVPIRRISKVMSQMEEYVNVREPSGIYDAGVRTQSGSVRYGGGSMVVSVYNPPFVKPSAYSEIRMKISNGDDAIQVGWRVDPSLRGDNRTRLFIYTDAGQSHCFDAQCGFVHMSTAIPPDYVLEHVSQPGGPIWLTKFNITRDQESKNWWLINNDEAESVIGFWPHNIFTGLRDLATNVEWAGEVYSPPGIPEPVMGSGYKPVVGDTKYVAFFRNMKIIDDKYTLIDVENLDEFATDRSLYDVKDKGHILKQMNHYVFFGGARY